jgi:alpha-tubulin suppressor-like RCC1 family protein
MKLKDVLAGSYHICVLDVEDKVFCWGRNAYGELAFAGNTSLSTPTVVPTQLTFKAFAQSTESAHTCAQTPSNQIACWGRRPGINVVATPTLIANGDPLRAHATDGEAECFLRQDARVYCWGLTGAVGFEPGVFRETPTPLAFFEPVVDLADECLLAQSGQPWCWSHYVGDGEYSPFLVYSSVPLVSFAKGGTSLCALTSDGAPYCRNWLAGSESNSFVRVAGDLRFRSLSASKTHACGTAVDGEVYCWGSNRYGEGGNGTFVDSPGATKLRDPIIP